jgi:hypothetical protein
MLNEYIINKTEISVSYRIWITNRDRQKKYDSKNF